MDLIAKLGSSDGFDTCFKMRFSYSKFTEVMLPCWNMNPCERPSFEMLEALLVGCSKKMIC